MMIHDVVQTIEPGAATSCPVGRSLVRHFETERDAENAAEEYRACCSVLGIRFEIETHDEESTERALFR